MSLNPSSLLTKAAAFFVAVLVLAASPVRAQDTKLKQKSPDMRKHIDAIMQKYKGHESYGKQVAEKAYQDSKARQVDCNGGQCPAAKKHEWDPNANQQSEQEYKADSLKVLNEQHLTQLWSCFEPKLILKPNPYAITCDEMCPDVWWCPRNREEALEFHWPQEVVYVNNYGINRLKPSQQSQVGILYEKPMLVALKTLSEQQEIIRLEVKKAIERKSLKLPDRSGDYKGQGHSEGFFGAASYEEQKLYGHGARTRVGYRVPMERPYSNWGWAVQKKCIFDGLGEPPQKKDILHHWTEYGNLDVVWNLPELTREHGQRERDGYEATTPPPLPIQEAPKAYPEWWRTKGPPSKRLAWWQKEFGDLKDVGIEEDNDQKAREFVYFGGGNLMPLTGTLDGVLGFPPLSAGAYIARRTFYINGSKEFNKYLPHGDKEKGRGDEYTVMQANKGREIDKMQLIWPPIEDAGPNSGKKMAMPTDKVPECFRSQKIPNTIHQTQNNWVKENFPHDLIKYVEDHHGEISFIAWNKRIVCTCECWGVPYGCTTMNDGDKTYDKFEQPVCPYMEGIFPSAFVGRKTQCIPNTKKYEGIDDNV